MTRFAARQWELLPILIWVVALYFLKLGLELLPKFRLVRVWPGDRPCIRPCGSTSAHVGLRFKYPAPRGVGERPGAAGYGISTSGSAHTLVLRSLKPPTDGKEHTVLLVGADEDCGGAKVSVIILDSRRRSRVVPQMRRFARTGEA